MSFLLFRIEFWSDQIEEGEFMLKEHKEFYQINVESGWENIPGYPEGIKQKILSGSLDEEIQTGTRSRLLRFEPGAYTTEPFEHAYWEEVFLVSGTLITQGECYRPLTYASRPPHVPHGPFKSVDGCVLFEIHFFNPLEKITPDAS